VKRDTPDLILLDAVTPKISGIDVCQKLKGDEATRNIQILLITSLDQEDHIARAVEAGTDDILIKPVNKLELILRIQSLLRNRRPRDEPQ
jgi:two-component system, OmpR family, alkaline phosphatase synthesis response regulator PhoP